MPGAFCFVFFMFFGTIALVVVVITAQLANQKKRTEALQAVAQELGFSFSAEGHDALLRTLANFPLFSKGHGRRIRNVMSGSAYGMEIMVFDYRYTTGGGKSSHTWSQTVAVFQGERISLPDFSLRPEGFFNRLGSFFGSQDIDFDSHPGFSESYLLKGNSEPSIRKLFTPGILDYFTRNPGLCVEAAADTLVYYRAGRRVQPQQMKDLMQEGTGILEQFVPASRNRD